MAETKTYSNLLVFRQGSLLTEENKITITRDFANEGVTTTARGWAGTAKGAPTTKVEINNWVPAKGVEYDPGPDGESSELIDWTFIRGAQQMTVALVVKNDGTDHAAGSAAGLSFSLEGGPSRWKPL